jgi:carbamoylphosphate synthase small subunit
MSQQDEYWRPGDPDDWEEKARKVGLILPILMAVFGVIVGYFVIGPAAGWW